MSAELLAKMTAKGLVITGEGFGGEVILSSSDVAGALARVRGIAYDFLLLKYCGDESGINRLVETFGSVISAKENRRSPGSLSLLDAEIYARQIIADNLGGDICRTCRGTGVYRYKNCQGCQGKGKRVPSERARAEALGLTRYEYKRQGKRIYDRYAGLLAEYEGSGLGELAWQMRVA